MNKLNISLFILIFGCTKNEFKIKDKVFSLDEFKTLVKQEDIQEYLLKNEYDLKQKLEEKDETILHLLLEKKMEAEALTLLDKLKELEQEERDKFLKRKNEKGDEALYIAIENGNTEILQKILELYSEKARNQRLCFEYYEETILDRAIKNRNAKIMIDLVELKERYRPKDLEKSESNKVKTEIVIMQVLSNIFSSIEIREIETRENEQLVEEVLLNEEEQKESLVLELIKESILKKTSNEVDRNIKINFNKLIREKKEEILILASYIGDKRVIERYLDEKEANTKDKEERTLLMLATQNSHKEVLELLINKGADIDLARNDGRTPLFVASQIGHKEIVELLINKGASIDLGNKNDGWTSLIVASQIGHKEVVELLLSNSASIDLGDKDGWTGLIVASENGHKEIVELLLTNGASIDLANKYGKTSLYIASANGCKEVVELLLSKGASIDLANKNGMTPLYIASHQGHKAVVELLLSKGASINLEENDGRTPLYIASQNGHFEIIELLINKGASIDLPNNKGYTPLMIASGKGYKEIVELLLSKEAAIDLGNKEGVTSLLMASQEGYKEVVELLINKGAEIDLANNQGVTPLLMASHAGHKEIVELLLTNGAFIGLAMNDLVTPLYIASINGHKEVVELLLSKGAAIDLAIKDGYTSLYLASQEGKKEIVELLLEKGASIDLADKDGITPLIIASQNGHKEIVELLLNKEASIDLRNKIGRTSLYLASRNGHKEVVELLLSKGASIDLEENDGATPLMVASMMGHKEVVELLLSKGASIDLTSNEGFTPLLTASLKGHKAVLELLINKGASVDLANNEGFTPLYVTIWQGHKEIVELLLSNGASVNLANKEGYTPLLMASLMGLKEVVELLLTKGASIDLAGNHGFTPLYSASETGHKEVVELLLINGASIDLANNNGYSSLYVASSKGHKELVEMLLSKGASINLASNEGFTPLYAASCNGHREVVELLINKGAPINLASNEGFTPLYVASSNGHKEVVELLLSKGASINLASNEGFTPLYVASSNGHKEVVELLLTKGASIDLASSEGLTPLLLATQNGHQEVVELFINKGAAINLAMNEGWTALMIASQMGRVEMVELLLIKGASVDLAMNDGWTSLMIVSGARQRELIEVVIRAAIDSAMNDVSQPVLPASWCLNEQNEESTLETQEVVNLSQPLLLPSNQGHKEIIELLINKGASIDLADKDGYTSLYVASYDGREEVVEVLLANGASIDLASKEGYTPLYVASSKGHKEVVKLLINKGAKIDLADKYYGKTSLYTASENGHREVVELLLTNGATIDLADKYYEQTPLYAASQNGHKEVVELLLSEEAAIDLVDKDGKTPLYIASQNGHKEIVELLINKGAAVDLADREYGTTPLLVASENGHREVVELLLSKGASINLASKARWTALMVASQKGHKEVVELLLSKGASIDLANKDGETPLYIASEKGHKEVVKLFVNNGAATDLMTKEYEQTPIYGASKNGHWEVVELLINRGALIDLAEKKYGETPIYVASKNGYREVVELLLNKGAAMDLAEKKYGETPIYAASQNGHREVVELLINKGASIDLANDNGATPLWIASAFDFKEVVELLLNKGAAIDLAEKKYEETPIYVASQNGHREVVELLLNKGAEIDSAIKSGYTPLYIASANGHEGVVELLLSKGAKIDVFKWRFPHKRDDFVQNIVSHVLKINNSSSIFFSEFLLQEKNIDLYIKLSNSLPVSFMIENFSYIPSHNYYGYNSLHLAVMQDSTESLIKLLSDRDIFAFVNSYDNRDKETCLSLAHRLMKLDHIKILLNFVVDPIYVKYGFFNRNINILDIPSIKEYVVNKIVFQAIKENRIENAAGLLNVGNLNNDSSYKKIINLKALDEEGNNVFHALAIHTNNIKMISSDNKMNVEHFLNRCLAKLENGTYEIPSFSEELIFAYNNLGLTPFHCAILYSNEDFVEYFLTSEKIKREDVTKLTRDGKSIFELIENNSVSKEVVTILIKHLWSNKDIESFYQSAKVNEEDKEIYKAIKEDRGDLIKDLKIKEEDVMRMINLSIKLNAFNCLKELISFIANEKVKSLFSTEFIFKMCEENKSEILDILIKLDEEKFLEIGKDGNTLIHKACLMKREEIVMQLVGYREVFEIKGREIVNEIKGYDLVRKNINIQNDQGNTAMHNAHVALSPSLIYILSKAGANANIKNKMGKRGIDLLKNIATVSQEEKIRMGTINAALCALLGKEYDGVYRLTLHLAILAKEDWVVKDPSLVGLINEVDEEENTALHLAVREDREEAIKGLLERGANFLLKNKSGETPLEFVRSKGALMLLINSALNKNIKAENLLNMQNRLGNTLLHLAVERAEVKRIEVVSRTQTGEPEKEVKEEINLRDKQLIEALLDNGASKDKVNREANTPIDLARKSKALEEFLMEYEPKLSIMQGRETIYFKKKEEEDRKNQRNQQEEEEVIEVFNGIRTQYQKLCTGRMPIHAVIERNDEFALEILLSKGFDLKCLFDADWLDNEGKNCYEIATNKLNVDVFKILIDKADMSNIFKETSSHASPIYLSITIEKGDKLFKAVFERLRKEYREEKFEIYKLKNDKQEEYSIREMRKDPITAIMKKDDDEMLAKMIEIGLKIVDEDGNNLVTESISQGARKIFKSLVNMVDNPEVFLRQYKQKKVAIESAQFQYSTIQDNFYLKAIRERLEKMKDGRDYFHILYDKVDAQEAIKVFEVLNGKRAHFEEVSNRRKAIHFLTEHKDVLGLNAVLKMGSDPEWEDRNGDNCYEIAINSADMSSNLECFKILLDHLAMNKSLIFETEKHPSILWLVLEKKERITRDKLLEVILKKMKKDYESKKFTFEEIRRLNKDPIGKMIEKDDKESLEKLIGIGIELEYIQNDLLEEARIKESTKIVDYLTQTFCEATSGNNVGAINKGSNYRLVK